MSDAQECIADLRAELNSLELTLATVSPADIEKHVVRYTKIQELISTYKDVLEKLQNACHEVEQAFADFEAAETTWRLNVRRYEITQSEIYTTNTQTQQRCELPIDACMCLACVRKRVLGWRIAELDQLRVVSLERITVAAANFSNE